MGTKREPGPFDCWGHAEPDEPVFVLAGRDPQAPAAVEAWALERTLAILRGEKPTTDAAQIREALAVALAMRRWRAAKTGLGSITPSANAQQTEAALRRIEEGT